MIQEELILVNDFCVHHHIEISFIHTLTEYGLLETTTYEESEYLIPEALDQAEKLVRLHRELSIHPEDMDVICHLLDKLEHLKSEMQQLQHRLDFYEQFDNPLSP